MQTDWDAIVVGASFGGLAAAMELTGGTGRVLVVDRLPVGAGETSACGTLLRVLERLDALEALEQVHEELVLHLPNAQTYRFRPRYPFATFDYERFCRLLWARTDAIFLRASVHDVRDTTVTTTEGTFTAPVVIDASGWRSAQAAMRRTPDRIQPRSLGVEAGLPVTDDGLHFWIRPPQLGCGITWLFPAGDQSRIGIGCYLGNGGLKPRLAAFLQESLNERLPADGLHGGSFPSRLRDPVAGRVFLVGDAAGQCLPLTAEGIRPALVFGQTAGLLGRMILGGTLPLEVALGRYRELVLARRRHYRVLELLQRALLAPADPGVLRPAGWGRPARRHVPARLLAGRRPRLPADPDLARPRGPSGRRSRVGLPDVKEAQ